MQNIRPSADLRNHYRELSKLTRDEKKPIYITLNGRGDTVLINQSVYESQMAELELLKKLSESEEDIQNNRVFDADSVFKELKEELFE